MQNKEGAKKCMNDYLISVLKSLFIKKPDTKHLNCHIEITECDNCGNKHCIIKTNVKYSFIGPVSDVNTEKIEVYRGAEIEKFTKEELEYAKEEVNIKKLVDLIYDRQD